MVINNYRQGSIKFDMRGVRVSAEEIIFYTGLILWLAQFYISRTVFLDLFGGRLITAVRYFCMLIFALKIFLTEKNVHLKAAAVFITAAAVFVVVQRQVNTGMPLIQVLLMIFAARDVSFRRICKVSLWTCTALWVLPVMIDRVGILQLERDVYKQRVREFLNFNYVSYASIYFNNIIFCALYVSTEPLRRGKGGRAAAQKTAPWSLILLLTAVCTWLLIVTDTTFPFAVGILFIALYVISVKFRIRLIPNKGTAKKLVCSCYAVFALVTYLMCKNYNWRIPWQKKLDDFSHSRISLAFLGIRDYGVHLLGVQIKENTDVSVGRYFYIDSGYIKNLLGYGLIVFIMIILYYTIIMYAAVLENDKVLAIWLFCMALYSIFNNLLLSVSENTALLAIWYAVGLLKWNRKKVRRGRAELKKYRMSLLSGEQAGKREQIERTA
ncbi:MAG: hypothetical protein IJ198_12810 [Lachnospiraceae bacterium]|nr:hypothetical protein [Lachnospiraceae bacterium]